MHRMTGYDAAFLYDERPEEPQHTLKVAIWSPEASARYSLEATRRFVGARLAELSPLRWRALRVPLDLYHPVWVADPALDLGFHIRSRALPLRAGHRELCEEISRIASRPLDPGKPLWELWMLEGYQDEKVVAVLKMSHALADGQASRRLIECLYAAEPITAAFDAQPPAWPGDPLPSRRALLVDAVRDRLHDGLHEIPRLGRANLAALRALHRTPIPSLYRGRRISLFSSPATPFAGPPTRERAFCFATVLLEEAREIRRDLDCTFNDVVLATAAGALRAYLRSQRALPGLPILAHMPASIRGEDERLAWGNRITSRPISLPTHIADPVARLRAASQVASEVKQDLERRRGANLEDWLRWLPPFASKGLGWAARTFVRLRPQFPGGITVSSVAGPRHELYAPGGPVENIISVGHLKYVAGLNITVWSYAEKLNFGIYSCPRSVSQPHLLAEMISDSFEALRKAATREAARIS